MGNCVAHDTLADLDQYGIRVEGKNLKGSSQTMLMESDEQTSSEFLRRSYWAKKGRLEQGMVHQNSIRKGSMLVPLRRDNDSFNTSFEEIDDSHDCCNSSCFSDEGSEAGTEMRGSKLPVLVEKKPPQSLTEFGPISSQYDSVAAALHSSEVKPIICIEIDEEDVTLAHTALHHPLIVEAAYSLFKTVRTKKQFGQKPRICFFDSRGKPGVDIVEGSEGCFSLDEFTDAMVSTLQSENMKVPEYLALLREEECGKLHTFFNGTKRRVDRVAVFAVGEVQGWECEVGGIGGVLATRVGYYDRRRVVKVTYNSRRLSYCNLVRVALERGQCRTIFYNTNDEKQAAAMEMQRILKNSPYTTLEQIDGDLQPEFERKHFLGNTLMRFVPMTELQSTRVNNLIGKGAFHEATRLLSPRQGAIMMGAMRQPSRRVLVDVPILHAWRGLSEQCESSMLQ